MTTENTLELQKKTSDSNTADSDTSTVAPQDTNDSDSANKPADAPVESDSAEDKTEVQDDKDKKLDSGEKKEAEEGAEKDAKEEKKPPAPPPAPPLPPAAAKRPGVDSSERNRYLKENFVDNYKQSKSEKEDSIKQLRDDLAPAAAGSTPAPGGGTSSAGGSALASVGSTPASAHENPFAPRDALKEGTSDGEGLEFTDRLMEGLGTTVGHLADAGNIASDTREYMGNEVDGLGDGVALVSGLAGTVFNGYGAIRGIMGTEQARMNGNKVGFNSGIWDNIGSILGVGGDITTAVTGAMGLAGSSNAGNVGNVISGSLGSLGAMSSLVGSAYRTSKYRQAQSKMSQMSSEVTAANISEANKNMRTAKKGVKDIDIANATAEEKASVLTNYDKANRARHSMKARKYAAQMGGAQAGHNRKQGFWDSIGNLSSIGAGLASIGGGIAGLSGSLVGKLVNTVVGAAFNIASTVAKTKNFASKQKHAAEHKDSFVTQYMTRKRDAILKAANTSGMSEDEKITADEAENIVLARMNNDKINITTFTGESQLPAHKDTVFEVLCDKRAENINQADDATRTEILTAMGLDPATATKQAIVEALGG